MLWAPPFACAEKMEDRSGGLKRRSLRSDREAETSTETEDAKQKSLKLTPGWIELSVSALFQAGVLGYYLFVLLNNVEALRFSQDAMYVLNFGGHWKFLTYINLVCACVITHKSVWICTTCVCTHNTLDSLYLSFHFFFWQRIQITFFVIADIFPWNTGRKWLKQLSDYVFISMVFPLTMVSDIIHLKDTCMYIWPSIIQTPLVIDDSPGVWKIENVPINQIAWSNSTIGWVLYNFSVVLTIAIELLKAIL